MGDAGEGRGALATIRRTVTRPAEEISDLEGAEALRGRVVGSLLLRDPSEASGQEPDDLPGEASMKLCLFEPCLRAGKGVVQITKLAQVSPCGEAEDARGGEDGTEGQPLRRLVDLAAQLAPDGWAEGVGSVDGRLRLG